MKKKISLSLNQALVLIITVIALVALGIYICQNFYQSFIGKQTKKAESLSKTEEQTEKTEEQTEKTESLSKTEMLSRGIHPDPVSIKVLEDITAQWQDNGITYTLKKVYLTPDIADLGSSRNNVGMKDKSFLIVELSVRDRRTTGGKRLIPAGNYLRIRQNERDSAPAVSDYIYLSPQEDGTIYVTFPVERNLSQFTLLVGILSRPRVIKLDFSSDSVNTKEGIFILKRGYFPEYSPDLHP